MPFAKTIPCSLGCITLLLAAAALSAAQAATLETRTCSLTMTNGVVVGLSNRLCGETLVRGIRTGDGLERPAPVEPGRLARGAGEAAVDVELPHAR